jgi:hypothetical protein
LRKKLFYAKKVTELPDLTVLTLTNATMTAEKGALSKKFTEKIG